MNLPLCNRVSQAVAAIQQALTRLARHVVVTCRQALRQLQHATLTIQELLHHYFLASTDAVVGAWRAAAARVTRRARREKQHGTPTRMADTSTFSRKSPGWKSGSPIPLKTYKSSTDLSSSGVWSVSRGGTVESLASTTSRSFASSSASFIASTPRYVP